MDDIHNNGEQAITANSHEDVALSGRIDADGVHRLIARIYFADTDFSGAVYHARYLEFLERGRSDFLRCVGITHTELLSSNEGEPMFWVVRRMEMDFIAPASIDDIVRVETSIDAIAGARIQMAQRLLCGDRVLVRAHVTAAIINGHGKPRRFPQKWVEAFSEVAKPQS